MFIVPMLLFNPEPRQGRHEHAAPRGLVKFSLPLTINLSLLRG